jgi:hypothetical protein
LREQLSKQGLLEDEGDEQVDSVGNDVAVLYVDRLLLDPGRRDTTQGRVGPSEANFHGVFKKPVSDLALISVTRATVPGTMTS